MNVPNLENSKVYSNISLSGSPCWTLREAFYYYYSIRLNTQSQRSTNLSLLKTSLGTCLNVQFGQKEYNGLLLRALAPTNQQGFGIRKSGTKFPVSSQLDYLFANDLGQIIYSFGASVSSSVK